MKRSLVVVLLLMGLTVLGAEAPTSSTSDVKNTPVTFNKDVLPILQNNCQSCHRPGEVAPMSFLSYESTRPWAKAIKTATASKKMPPWFADSHFGEFRNAPKITQKDIDTLAAWADTGAAEGSTADKPAAVEFRNGWRIQPDVVVSMPQAFRVAAQGTGEIREFFVPNPFKEDTWVNSIEIRPGDPSVVHHVIVQTVDRTRDTQLRSQLATVARTVALKDGLPQGIQQNQGGYFGLNGDGLFAKLDELRTGKGAFMSMEAVYAPGAPPLDFRYTGSAKLIPRGGEIRIEVHYTPNGKETLDQTTVGFTLAKNQPDRRFVLMAPEHLVDPRKPIPAGDANWETTGEITFSQDAELAWFMPHMHLRGKDMTYQLIYPDGKVQTVLNAKFNFQWQLGYELEKPISVPKGTRLVVTAHHDNSSNNRSNPNATESVVWGDLTSQEMMLPWFGVVVNNRDAAPGAIASYRPRDLIVDDTLRALDRLVN